jgi:uncharacterized protein with GYD domain
VATYISLVSFTPQGIASFKDTVDRGEAADQLAAAMGGTIKSIHWTLGPYDIVVVSESPDDETATAFALKLAAQGNIRTTTMRAFSGDEMRGIIAKTG